MPVAKAGLFAALREAAADDWRSYVEHPFVQGLGDGTLPEAAFRHYLVQDYLFLIQFARAYGLAAYKADTLAEIRAASDGLKALVEVEMDLHRAYCADWGLDEAALDTVEADGATLAYTAYVLERGLAGDLLDLRTALAPCVIGYGEIGARLAADSATRGGRQFLRPLDRDVCRRGLSGVHASRDRGARTRSLRVAAVLRDSPGFPPPSVPRRGSKPGSGRRGWTPPGPEAAVLRVAERPVRGPRSRDAPPSRGAASGRACCRRHCR